MKLNSCKLANKHKGFLERVSYTAHRHPTLYGCLEKCDSGSREEDRETERPLLSWCGMGSDMTRLLWILIDTNLKNLPLLEKVRDLKFESAR